MWLLIKSSPQVEASLSSLVEIGNVDVEILCYRRGIVYETGASRVALAQNLKAPLLIPVAAIGQLDDTSYGVSWHGFIFLQCTFADQLGT